MIGAEGEVLYVGKARSIKKRILAYTTPERQSMRIARMVAQTRSMVFVTTETEAEALLLEANLIKQLKPRYNVLLRDDKSFPYILIARGEAARLVKHRGARSIPGDYFGPFASAGAVFRTMNALQRAFLLRTCSDSYYENRTRPCLLYQIKRCSGPCTGEIGLDDYAGLVKEAKDFLSGRSLAIRRRLAEEMAHAAEALEFERAARLRDRISALSAISGEQSVNPRSIPEADVFAIAEEAGQYGVEVFFFRTYQNWGNRAYFPRADRALGPEEVLDAFLAQFYLERPAPRLVLLSHPVASAVALCEVLSARTGRRIAIGVPRRGEKRDLQGLFVEVDRLGGLPQGGITSADLAENFCFALATADLAVDGEGLLVELDRFGNLPQVAVAATKVGEIGCFGSATTDLAVDGEGLLVEVDRLENLP